LGIIHSFAQGTLAEYKKSIAIDSLFKNKIYNTPKVFRWVGNDYFWYINPIAKGKEYWVFDTQQQKQHLAFDHSRLATSLSKVLGKEVSPYQLSRQFRIQQGFFDFDICC
jgi:hypothetical protein